MNPQEPIAILIGLVPFIVKALVELRQFIEEQL
jgi:hypothetical protein